MTHIFPGMHRIRRNGLLACTLSTMALLSGCTHPSSPASVASPSPALAPSVLLLAVDRSESTRPLRAEFFEQMDYMTSAAIGNSLPLDVWAYDRSALRVYGPRNPQSREELDQIKRTELAPNDAHLRKITRPALLLEAWVNDRAMHHTTGGYAVILTDGDAEVADDEHRLVAAAKALGKDPTFRLAVIDIKPEDRKMWDNALTKGMPGRYILAGQSEATTTLKEFLQGTTNQ